MTGYCARLAEAHNLRVGTFLGKIVNPFVAQSSSVGSTQKRRLGWETAHFHLINGTGTLAADFCTALQKLTLRPDLSPLTLLHWTELFPSAKGLLRPHRAWCPACFAERRSAKLPVYEHLVWTLAPVKICLRHDSPLRECCPHCETAMKPLTVTMVPGHCSRCDGWLGVQKQFPPEIKPHEKPWLRRSAGVLSDLIVINPTRHLPNSYRTAFFDAVRFWSAQAGIYSAAALADAAQCHKTTAREWLTGINMPEVGQFLRLLDAFNLNANDFFNKQRTGSSEQRSTPLQRSRTKKWTRRSFDTEAIKTSLKAVLDAHTAPPPTVTEFCRRNQYVRSEIYKHLPQLCMALAAKGARHRTGVSKLRLEGKLRAIHQAVRDACAEGLPLVQTTIVSRLPKPGIFRNPRLKAALRGALAEMSH